MLDLFRSTGLNFRDITIVELGSDIQQTKLIANVLTIIFRCTSGVSAGWFLSVVLTYRPSSKQTRKNMYDFFNNVLIQEIIS